MFFVILVTIACYTFILSSVGVVFKLTNVVNPNFNERLAYICLADYEFTKVKHDKKIGNNLKFKIEKPNSVYCLDGIYIHIAHNSILRPDKSLCMYLTIINKGIVTKRIAVISPGEYIKLYKEPEYIENKINSQLYKELTELIHETSLRG